MRILFMDIETSPNLAYVWGLFKQNVAVNQIKETGSVLCWAAKWYGEEQIYFDSVHTSKPKTMLKGIHKLLEEADVVVHYNGARFDIPTLNKEFLLHQMLPPSTYKQVDLLQTARNRFRFTSNKLEFVADAVGVGNKYKHSGFDLWVRCIAGDKDAWAEMEVYNKQDVQLLEGLYQVFLPWIKNHPNMALYDGDSSDVHTCPSCGSHDLKKRGFSYTSVSKYPRYRCSGCGTWSRGRRSVPLTHSNVVIDK